MFHGLKPGLTYQVAIGATSAASSNVITFGTKYLRVLATVACNIQIGPSPTASQTTSLGLAANWPEYLMCSSNNNEKIAVIEVTGGTTGTLTVTEMTS